MTTTWAEFLKNHKDNEEYNKVAVEVADLCKPMGDKNQAFSKLTKTQPLVVVSKRAVDWTAKYLFNFFNMGNSISKHGIKFVAMIGFGKRATPVSVDPTLHSSSQRSRKAAHCSKIFFRQNWRRTSRI